ncbi:MAG: right-handed parallel beta-helix repeat-containing protein [Phycisphaerae bacterium]|nr:right-handed parallel beta-helix repeat-containing protein [Phycisphaerae bacterium]
MKKSLLAVLFLTSICFGADRSRYAPDTIVPYLVASVNAPSYIRDIAQYKCDGIRDDYEINLAITDSNTAGYGLIPLSEGTFNLRAPIKPDRNITLEGVGQRSVVKKPSGLWSALTVNAANADTHVHVADSNGFQANDEVYLAANNKTDFSAEYYTITSVVGNIINLTPSVDDAYTTAQSAILTNEFPAIRIGKTGLGSYNRSNVEIKGIKIEGNYANRNSDNKLAYRNSLIEIEASSATESNNIRITDVQLYNATACSIYSHYAKRVFVHGLIANNTKGKANWGIQIGGASRDVVVENCHEVDSNYGFYACEEVNNLSVTDCSFGSNQTSALLIGLNDGPMTFSACNFYDFEKVGMTSTQAGSFGTLIGCNFTQLSSSAYPIMNLTGASTYTLIGNRLIKGTPYAETSSVNISGDDCILLGNYIRHKFTGTAKTSAAVNIASTADDTTVALNRIFDGGGLDINDLGTSSFVLTPAAGAAINDNTD